MLWKAKLSELWILKCKSSLALHCLARYFAQRCCFLLLILTSLGAGSCCFSPKLCLSKSSDCEFLNTTGTEAHFSHRSRISFQRHFFFPNFNPFDSQGELRSKYYSLHEKLSFYFLFSSQFSEYRSLCLTLGQMAGLFLLLISNISYCFLISNTLGVNPVHLFGVSRMTLEIFLSLVFLQHKGSYDSLESTTFFLKLWLLRILLGI